LRVIKNGVYNKILKMGLGWDTAQLGSVEIETWNGVRVTLTQSTYGGFEDPHWVYSVWVDESKVESSIDKPGELFEAFKALIEELYLEDC